AVTGGALISHYSDSTNGSHYEKAVAITPDGSTFLRVCFPGKIFAARVPLWIYSFTREGNNWLLSWTVGGHLYQRQQRTNLTGGAWQNIGPVLTKRRAEIQRDLPSVFFRVITPR